MEEKVLTKEKVNELGLYRVSVITSDMLDGYTHIDSHAFVWCDELTSITIPDSVISIGDYAFYNCYRLTSITIGNGVTSIGKMSFYGCRSLSSIEIPNSVISIRDYAFSCCISLTSVTIPNSVTSIDQCAFSGCNGLSSIEIPNSVTHIGIGVFYYCKLNNVERKDEYGRIVAYKGFNANMTCLGFQYKEGETYELDCEPIICERGFHACLNPIDCLNYYGGEIGKEVAFHEVYLEGVSDENHDDSKVVAKKITIGREISLSEMADIVSERK